MTFSNCHDFRDVLITLASMLTKPIDEDAKRSALSDSQAFLRPFPHINRQILYFLVVDLTHRRDNFVLFVRVCVCLDPLKYFLASQWYNAFILSVPNHRMTFARSGLPVCKKAGMEAFPGSFKDAEANFFEYVFLIFVPAVG